MQMKKYCDLKTSVLSRKMKTYWKDMKNTLAHKKDRETAEKLIKKGKMSLEDIADCVPSLSLDELKGIEAELMQMA